MGEQAEGSTVTHLHLLQILPASAGRHPVAALSDKHRHVLVHQFDSHIHGLEKWTSHASAAWTAVSLPPAHSQSAHYMACLLCCLRLHTGCLCST